MLGVLRPKFEQLIGDAETGDNRPVHKSHRDWRQLGTGPVNSIGVGRRELLEKVGWQLTGTE
jgi:hypothetical protein